jgi:low temperature requirement protein LtrA
MPGLGQSRTQDWNIEGGHFAERCGLFIIIALGESIVVTGATFSGLAWTAATSAAFGAAAVSSVALWWLYFDTVADVGSQTLATAHDPGRLARGAYTYIHLLIVAGIIVSAVADEVVLTRPTGANDARTSISVLGGSALYLLGNLCFKWAIARRVRISHVLGMVVLVVLIPGAHAVSPLTLLLAVTMLLVVIAVWEAHTKRRHAAL